MQNTVAGLIPLAMKVLLLLKTETQMETMRLESELIFLLLLGIDCV